MDRLGLSENATFRCHAMAATTVPTVPDLVKDFVRVRDYTMRLAAPLSEEDCCAQSMCDASPVKWHLAHTSWFFETFMLEPYEPRFVPFCPVFRTLFNSYYNGVGGELYPRAERGLLTRPPLSEIRLYRANVDRRVRDLLSSADCDPRCAALVELGMHHEQQHQELLLTDVKHLMSMNGVVEPVAYPPGWLPSPPAPVETDNEWLVFDEAVVEIGHRGPGFCFDNELPRHRQFVERFACGARLVTNAEYLAFVNKGGYDDPDQWLAAGWEWRLQACRRTAGPLYWRRNRDAGSDATAAGWYEFTLNGPVPLDPNKAVTHLSYYEADAFARWSGARLPTEAEWERAAGSDHPDGQQFFGTAWQWTSSSYTQYPGYVIPAGAVGEYNGKFMVNQYVLRGSSIATPEEHARLSYRNFFPATARWQYTGIRLAKSLQP
ncbi:Ergothioneine biosynthesis protein EgtB,DinB/YfiT-like putative metalloenzymes,C-type lectin [Cinara cedri]|uniref:Ergothioneine biosynthesis protein EgtB,DinB/YfiT-like putative metalloenzymes,C-type lectin n=1 Tax=Cinara cedri TaxID=506608 RepID=A0A5E4MQR9_9HEMI|nr:Ergothioneine biosynthesis protein EgtB,DinB/YfiT-like putative metalloenzymes,C-type lectin [Cinara cedri]